MAQEHAFLQSIIAEPDEDAHRLVYADWLEDTADAANRLREQVRTRFGPDALGIEQKSPQRPGYYSWWDL